MKRKIFCIILIISICIFPIWAQQIITFKPYLPKDTFLLGEPIDFGMTLTNNSNSIIKEQFVKIVRFRILNEDNKPLSYKGRVMFNMSGLVLTLKPREAAYPIFDLIGLYGQEYKLAPLYQYIPIGKYTIEVTFTPPNKEKRIINVPFQVVLPEGEEAEVYNNFMRTVKSKHSASEVVNILQSLYQNNPSSVYNPFILMLLDAEYDIVLKNHEKAFEVRKELIEHYPSSGYAHQMLGGILKSMTTDSERTVFLEKIKTNCRSEFMKNSYEQQIQTIKAKESH